MREDGDSGRVCIVGAGIAGLTCAKTCLQYGLHPVIYEQTSDIGGLWRYKQHVQPGIILFSFYIPIYASKQLVWFWFHSSICRQNQRFYLFVRAYVRYIGRYWIKLAPAGIRPKRIEYLSFRFLRFIHFYYFWSTGVSSVMKSTIINTSKEVTALSDFPIAATTANFMHNTQVINHILLKRLSFVSKLFLYKLQYVTVTDFADAGLLSFIRWPLLPDRAHRIQYKGGAHCQKRVRHSGRRMECAHSEVEYDEKRYRVEYFSYYVSVVAYSLLADFHSRC